MTFPIRSSSSPSRRGPSPDLGRQIADRVHSAVRGGAPSAGSALHAQIRSGIHTRDSFEPGITSRPPVNLSGAPAPVSRPTPTSPGSPAAPVTPTTPSSSTGLDSTGDSAQVDGWIAEAEQRMGRDFTAEEEQAIRTIAYYESRNDPSAVNGFDANAQAGNPSEGLMQVTRSNFQTYNPGGDPFDPVDSIIAAVRYSDERYGGIDKSKGVVDLANGGATDPYGGWNGGYTWY